MAKIIEKIDAKLLGKLNVLIAEGIDHFRRLDFEIDAIRIYMPEYMKRKYIDFNKRTLLMPEKLQGVPKKLQGVNVYDGYENQIIISVEDNLLRGINPIKIDIN